MVQIPGLILGNGPKKNHRLKRWSVRLNRFSWIY